MVADDASTDQTSDVALLHGAQVVARRRSHGKGGNVTAAAESVMGRAADPQPPTFLLCDADLGSSAAELRLLVEAIEGGSCDLAIGAFRDRVGGGFGITLGFARWAIERRCGYRAGAALSGQRAMRAEVLGDVLPLAAGYGLETAMTIDAVRGGYRLGRGGARPTTSDHLAEPGQASCTGDDSSSTSLVPTCRDGS